MNWNFYRPGKGIVIVLLWRRSDPMFRPTLNYNTLSYSCAHVSGVLSGFPGFIFHRKANELVFHHA